MSTNFKEYSKYYDLLYIDKDYNLESQYICDTLKRLGCERGHILELGSGTGRHGRLISKCDYTVLGIEKSPEMILEAETTDRFSCQVGDICNLALGVKFDAILSLFHVVSYLTINESLNSLFNSARIHLNRGGIFLFDVWYSPAVYSMKPTVRIKRVNDDELEIVRISEPEIVINQNVVNVNFTLFVNNKKTNNYTVINEVHSMRHFSIPELVILAKYHGFACILTEEFITRNIPSEKTWGVCFGFKKI
jgi:SAM-dependent methyltransferase